MSVNIINNQRLIPGLIEPTGQSSKTVDADPPEGKFSDLFSEMLNSVNDLQHESADLQQAYFAGEPVELHQVMIKAEEAGLSMDLLLEIRNRLLSTYTELVKMPI